MAIENQFSLHYVSQCPVKYNLSIEGKNFEDNNVGPMTFSCHPSSGIVESEGDLKVNIHFHPQVKKNKSQLKARVVVRCQEDELGSVNLEGRCLGKGMHIQVPNKQVTLPSPGDGFSDPLQGLQDSEDSSDVSEPFTLEFESGIRLSEKKEETFEIVNAGGGMGEFSFEPLSEDIVEERWSINPSKGQIAEGSSAQVALSLEIPEEVPSEFLAYFGLESWMEGKWKCKLTNGDQKREFVFVSRCLVKPK